MMSAEKHQEPNGNQNIQRFPGTRSSLSESDGTLAMTPSPPPNKPKYRRPASSVRSQRLNSARSTSSDDRPSSSAMSKYNVLPPIDKSTADGDHLIESTRKLSISKDDKHQYSQRTSSPSSSSSSIRIPTGGSDEPSGDDTVTHSYGKRKNSSTENSRKQKTLRTLHLSDEPKEAPRLELKVKLPGGEELKRYFRPSEQLQMVLDFVELEMKTNLTGYTLVRNFPIKEFTDLSLSLEGAGIEDRTLLNLQTPAPE